MARGRVLRSDLETPFVINAREPGLGPGVLVKQNAERRTYRFVKEERSFKEAYCKLYIKPTYQVAPEVRAKLLPEEVKVKDTAPVPAAAPPPLTTNADLEAQICANPDEPGPYLVYADWLQQRGDPRGDLITVQAQLADAPRKKELLDAEKKLLDAHRAYFVPPALDAALRLPKRGGTRCEVTWNHGFFAHVRLAKPATPAAQDIHLGTVAQAVLGHPSARFLRSLAIGPLGTPVYDYAPIIKAIARQKHPLLDEIHIGDFTSSDNELVSTTAGNVAALFRVAPAMRKLTIKAGVRVRFDGKIAHAKLRELSVTTLYLAAKETQGLFDARLPALERLSLVTEGLEIDAAQREKLTEGFLWPALRHLTLRGMRASNVNALFDVLVESPLTARLASLDIGLDAAAMKKLVAKHPHLDVRSPDSKRFAITDNDVVRRAPDKESMAASRKIAHADKWMALGYDPRRQRLWGEYEGRDHYYVYAALPTREAGCDCGSRKDPCKHALALLLLAANQHDFVEQAPPEALVRNASQERPRYVPVWE
jgi:uncharacterized protein (TIGR02996 family)